MQKTVTIIAKQFVPQINTWHDESCYDRASGFQEGSGYA